MSLAAVLKIDPKVPYDEHGCGTVVLEVQISLDAVLVVALEVPHDEPGGVTGSITKVTTS